ncbi:Uncharacterised protein [Klebsiella pneumoniae]|nr:Uncharacterised protein [Klebsiella pneumoniae]SLV35703.1 Uncharacterised protein [Klebsiella pneumoniae]SLY21334.1 Uncharacterised protein [Klebsiella pneumoniae]
MMFVSAQPVALVSSNTIASIEADEGLPARKNTPDNEIAMPITCIKLNFSLSTTAAMIIAKGVPS